jgi:hypothetical protein
MRERIHKGDMVYRRNQTSSPVPSLKKDVCTKGEWIHSRIFREICDLNRPVSALYEVKIGMNVSEKPADA